MVRIVLSIVVVAAMASESMAQGSLYTTSQVNQLKSRNSASGFTRERMSSNVINRAVPRYNFSTVNQRALQGATGATSTLGRPGGSQMGSKAKPFSNTNTGPAASPYLGLLSETPFTSSTTNYFSKVRPQIEQQKMNEKLMSQNMQLQQKLQAVAAEGPYSPTGSEDRAPTGHAAVYMNNGGTYGNNGGYFPQIPIRSIRQQKR